MSLTNQDISQPSLCHLSLGSSMVRASHRRSEGCGFDSRLGLRNIFWVCESLCGQKRFSPVYMFLTRVHFYIYSNRVSNRYNCLQKGWCTANTDSIV